MADEITVSARLQVRKGGITLDKNFQAIRVDMAGDAKTESIQPIGFAAHEVLVLSDGVTTAGYAYFHNLDITNFVQIGIDSGGTFHPLVKLFPGEVALFRLATSSVYAKADTASVNLEYGIVEN